MYYGSYLKAVIICPTNKKNQRNKNTTLRSLSIKKSKLNGLQHLKQLLINPDAQTFYVSLISDEDSDEDIVEYADDPLIDDNEDP